MKQLWDLAGVFAYLSLLTVGGGMAAFPEMKTLTVDTYHWVTFPELLHFYSLGQLAPGPNMMMVASIGVTVASPSGWAEVAAAGASAGGGGAAAGAPSAGATAGATAAAWGGGAVSVNCR